MKQFPNLVELITDETDKIFDQPCKNGCRILDHAVYCHSTNPAAPRKCPYSWRSDGKLKDQDCPFFEPNTKPNNMKKAKQTPEEKEAAKEVIKDQKQANKSIDGLIKRAKLKGAFICENYKNKSNVILNLKDLFFNAWVFDTGHD